MFDYIQVNDLFWYLVLFLLFFIVTAAAKDIYCIGLMENVLTDGCETDAVKK